MKGRSLDRRAGAQHEAMSQAPEYLRSLVGPIQDVHALTRHLGTLVSGLRSALADG